MTQAFVELDAEMHQALERGPVIVPNERLARELRRAYELWQEQRGSSAWRPAPVFSWNGFLRHCYARTPESIRQPLVDDSALALLMIETLPSVLQTQALDAWNLSHAYRLQDSTPETVLQRRFSEARQTITRRLAETSSVTTAQLADLLTTTSAPFNQLTLFAFDHLSPAQRGLVDHWAAAGARVETLAPPQRTASPVRHSFARQEYEIAAAANWARQALLENPEARIGIVVPDKQIHHDVLLYQVCRHLDPEQGTATRAVDAGTGGMLADLALWRDAQQLLGWLEKPISRQAAKAICRSPYMRLTPLQSLSRAPQIHLHEVGKPALLRRLATEHGQLEQARQPLSAWIAHYRRQLEVVQWGGAELGSTTWQARQAIDARLRKLAGESTWLTQLPSAVEALNIIDAALAQTPFSVERPAAPVQILGALETTGLRFTHLWVTGFDDVTLPARAKPNPLLPLKPQQQAGVSRVDAAGEAEFARDRWQHWQTCADTLVVSHVNERLGSPNAPSPLIRFIPETAGVEPETNAHPRAVHERLQAEPWHDDRKQPLAGPHLPGGAGALSAQAHCSFRAFGYYLIKVTGAEDEREFPSASEIGLIIHSVLEKRSKADITGMDASLTLADAVRLSLPERCQHWPDAARHALVQSLTARVSAWIDYEYKWPEHQTVEIETARTVQLAEFEVRLQIDRIDRWQDSLVVIDYKTGSVPSIASLADADGMTQVQLPLYALADDQVHAVMYGRVQEPPKLIGLATSTMDTTGLRIRQVADWPQQTTSWQERLTHLAVEFARGPAVADPVNTSLCSQCPVRGICRFRRLNA